MEKHEIDLDSCIWKIVVSSAEDDEFYGEKVKEYHYGFYHPDTKIFYTIIQIAKYEQMPYECYVFKSFYDITSDIDFPGMCGYIHFVEPILALAKKRSIELLEIEF